MIFPTRIFGQFQVLPATPPAHSEFTLITRVVSWSVYERCEHPLGSALFVEATLAASDRASTVLSASSRPASTLWCAGRLGVGGCLPGHGAAG